MSKNDDDGLFITEYANTKTKKSSYLRKKLDKTMLILEKTRLPKRPIEAEYCKN